MSPVGRLDNLQALRGAACLLVVAAHVGGVEALLGGGFAPARPFRWTGQFAIDLLFFLSGFILTHAHLGPGARPVGLGKYLFRRGWRVFPTYWAALGLALAVFVALGMSPTADPNWAGDLRDMILLRPRSTYPVYLPVVWTMAYEVLFYAAFALALVVPGRAAAAAGAAWAAAIGWLAAVGYTPGNEYLRHLFGPLMLELLGGCFVAWAASRPRVFPRLGLAAGAAWLAVGTAAIFDPDPHAFGNPPVPILRVLALGPAAALLVYAAATLERGGWRAPRWLCRVGDWSYSIYLLHGLALIAVFQLTVRMGMGHTRGPHLVWLGLMLGGSVALGWVFYRLVEKPVMDVVRRKRPAPAAPPAEATAVPLKRAA